MTTQPNQDDVAAFREEHLFNELWLIIDDTAKSRKVEKIVRTYLQQSNRQLLDEVEAAGPINITIKPPYSPPVEQAIRVAECAGYNTSNDRWHQAIQAIKERRGL